MRNSTLSVPTVLIALIAACVAPEAWSQSEPGQRPDLAPSSLEFWSTLEGKTLDQIREVKEIGESLEEAREKKKELTEKHANTEEGAWWQLFGDEKTRVGKEIKSLAEKIEQLEDEEALAGDRLKDYLASTPGGKTSLELEVRDYRLSKEAIEIRNALENLSAMGRRLVEEMKRNPKDTSKAVDCYDAQLRALGYVQLMHNEFVRRCNEDYPRYLDDLQQAAAKEINSQREMLISFDGPEKDAEIIERNIEKVRQIEERIPVLRSNVVEMERWATSNLESVRNKKVVLASLRNSAELVDRAKDIASSISAAFGELEFEEPPLIEFEFDPATLDIDMGGEDPYRQ